MIALVLAQGDGRRWEDTKGRPYLGLPKHLIEWTPGETMIARTVRLLQERNVPVVVVARDDDRYRFPNAGFATLDDPNPSGCDMSKFTATRHLWAPHGRTVIFWGDVFYTEEAIDTIVNHPSDDYHVFRRPGRSSVTGHGWDESFAVSFGPHEYERVIERAEFVTDMFRRGKLRRTPIRCHLAAMDGLSERHINSVQAVYDTPSQTHIDDFTDDIDSPQEYANWSGRYHEHGYKLAVVLPWMGGDFYRWRAHDYVVEHYEAMGVPVIEGFDDSGGQWNNRARACNNGVREAFNAGFEVVLIGDADTFIPRHQLWAAAHTAMWTGNIVIGFDSYVRLGPSATKRLVEGKPSPKINGIRGHVSGAVMVTPKSWATIGGFDERFLAWGGEDRCLWMTAKTLLGKPPRIVGNAYHLHHTPSPESDPSHPSRAETKALGRRYMAVTGHRNRQGMIGDLNGEAREDAEALVELLREPGGPLDDSERVRVPVKPPKRPKTMKEPPILLPLTRERLAREAEGCRKAAV